MADERDTKVQEALQSASIGQEIPNFPSEFREATREVDHPVPFQSSADLEETTFGASVQLELLPIMKIRLRKLMLLFQSGLQNITKKQQRKLRRLFLSYVEGNGMTIGNGQLVEPVWGHWL